MGVSVHVAAKFGRHGTVARSASMFKIKIETINHKITEWSRASVAAWFGSKHLPHLRCERSAIGIAGKIILISRCGSSDRDQDLLSFTLAVCDTGLELGTTREHIGTGHLSSSALIAKVRNRVPGVSILIWRATYKTDGNDIDIVVVTHSFKLGLSSSATIVGNDFRICISFRE